MGEEPEAIAIPEWVVTFGDMMSLLLTFFIMLVSLSEIKEEETYQAKVDAISESFGYTRAVPALAPGDSKPRSSKMMVQSTTGRARKKDTATGGVDEKAPTGENPHVRNIRPGRMTAQGSSVLFAMASDTLDASAKKILDQVAVQLKGKPQKIEVRGHTSLEFATRTRGTREPMALGFRRAEVVYRYLVDVTGIPDERFRLSSAGGSEPTVSTGGGSSSAKNSRVEVFLLDETVEDLRGTPDLGDSGTNTDNNLPTENE